MNLHARRFLRITLTALLIGALLLAGGCERSIDPVSLFRDGEFARALELFREQAAAGDMAAVNFIGIHYYLGAGVPRDFGQAFQYFEQAALENDANAQRNLAIMYMRGLGVAQDNHRAYGWFFQAYTSGNQNARLYLVSLADNVTPNAGGKAREWVAEQIRAHAHAVRDAALAAP